MKTLTQSLNEASNESEYIKSTKDRTLTAKGVKFLWQCIDIVADNNGLHKYSPELKPVKEKLSNLIYHLFIDKKMTKNEIIDVIKNRKVDVGLNESLKNLYDLKVGKYKRSYAIFAGEAPLQKFKTEQQAQDALDKDFSYYEYWAGSAGVSIINNYASGNYQVIDAK